ncbi:hypothetical protein VSR68_35635 [Paraburkholderia phymatum]|uniref:hypothetical protein n=1 Tax=Paraburkholderia phymatum TaxID=148447 RepID=UPI0031754C88
MDDYSICVVEFDIPNVHGYGHESKVPELAWHNYRRVYIVFRATSLHGVGRVIRVWRNQDVAISDHFDHPMLL